MIITWGKGRATKVPNKAIQERKTEERVEGGKGRTARDRGINNTSAQSTPVVAWGELLPDNTRHSHLLDLASHGSAHARGKK